MGFAGGFGSDVDGVVSFGCLDGGVGVAVFGRDVCVVFGVAGPRGDAGEVPVAVDVDGVLAGAFDGDVDDCVIGGGLVDGPVVFCVLFVDVFVAGNFE